MTMVFCGILKWPSDLTVCCGRLMNSFMVQSGAVPEEDGLV